MAGLLLKLTAANVPLPFNATQVKLKNVKHGYIKITMNTENNTTARTFIVVKKNINMKIMGIIE